MNIFLQIIKYDAGLMDRHEELVFFQHLLNIGLLPHMSAHYQQTAQWLLAAGEINAGTRADGITSTWLGHNDLEVRPIAR